MSVFSRHFPLGLGTARFPVSGPKDMTGIDRSVQMVLSALERGVDYVDVAYTYSAGMTPMILKEAFRQTARPFSTTAKVRYPEDRTADQARKRVELYLNSLGLDHIAYFTCWCIWSYQDFQAITAKGGLYDGALKLKEEGIIDHICCSLHAPPDDIVKILDSGAFEGATISYSMLNAPMMQPVLEKACEKGVGIAVMNPLGGGLIAQNRDYFSFACGDRDGGDTVHAALRFVKAHPAVDIVLGGVSSQAQMEDSFGVLSTPDPEPPAERLSRVLERTRERKGFCTGCKYCAGCPKGIPTASIMQAHNAMLFQPAPDYNRAGPDRLLYDLQIFRRLFVNEGWLPETAENPCVRCGRCMKQCTQKLDIIGGVAEVYQRAEACGYSTQAHRDRVKALFQGKSYKKVGLYPNGGLSTEVIRLYQEQLGEPEHEWLLFNSDPKTWGLSDNGRMVHSPSEIPALRPDVILITTYRYEQEVADSLRPCGIPIEKLHQAGQVPWVF